MKKYIYFYKKILLTKKKYNVKIIINYGKLMFTFTVFSVLLSNL